MSIANKVQLLGKSFLDEKIVQKVLVTKNISLSFKGGAINYHLGRINKCFKNEETKGDYTRCFPYKGEKNKKSNKWKNKKKEGSNNQQGENFLSCPHFKKTNHPKKKRYVEARCQV